MKKLILLVVCLNLWAQTAVGDAIVTEIYPDLAGSLNKESESKLKSITKTARVTYSYTLNNNAIWTQFPDLAIDFYLAFDQRV